MILQGELLDFDSFRSAHPQARVYVFDVDHTITSHATGVRVILDGFRRGYVRLRTMLSIPLRVRDYHRGSYGVDDIPEEFKDLRGASRDFLEDWGRSVFEKKIRHDIFPACEDFIRQARQAGVPLMLSSATFDFIIKPLAEHLAIGTWMATRVRYENDVCTGEMLGKANFSEGKVAAVREAVEALGFTLADVAFFSDSNNDLPLLEMVGHPVPVHADKLLRRECAKRGWKVHTFCRKNACAD